MKIEGVVTAMISECPFNGPICVQQFLKFLKLLNSDELLCLLSALAYHMLFSYLLFQVLYEYSSMLIASNGGANDTFMPAHQTHAMPLSIMYH